jgi:putative addiction module component (TIGR02574 family)
MIGDFPELERLSPQEKLVLAGELLHQAAEPDDSGMEADPEMVRLLEKRLEHYRKNPHTALPWEEVKEKIRSGRH